VRGAAAGKPGQVVLVDYPEPIAQDDDIILKPLVCGVCSTDVKMVKKGASNTNFALGHELVGKVIKAAPSLPWQIGQRVVVAPYLPCGECFYCQHGQSTLCTRLYETSIMPGGMAERVLVPAELARRGMFAIQEGISDIAVALSEPLGCVLKGLTDAHFQSGDSLVIIGDGPMGQLAAAAGKALGSSTVIVAGATTHRLEAAKRLYADLTIDIRVQSLTEAVADGTGDRRADVVLVTVSSGDALKDGINIIRPGGWVNAFAGVPEGTCIELDVRKLHYQQYHLTGSSGLSPQDLRKALEMIQSGKVDFSKIVTASFPFPHVEEAVDYMEKRTGLKAVVTFN